MNVMFTFPGQGTQVPQMLHQLPPTDLTKNTLDQASEALGEECLNLDSVESLKSTRSVQICLLIYGVIYAKHLMAAGVIPDMVSGLSIGAFPAAVISGVVDFPDAIKIVSLRGELMQQAYPKGYGMAAIIGLDPWTVDNLVTQVNSDNYPVYLSNINAERQVVIAGSEEALLKVMSLAQSHQANKVKKLTISVPSHCALLNKPAQQLAEAMRQFRYHAPTITYMSSNSARIVAQSNKIENDLAYNMARSVHWSDTVLAAFERGCRLIVEMPPGNTLTKLARTVITEGEAIALSSNRTSTIVALYHRVKNS